MNKVSGQTGSTIVAAFFLAAGILVLFDTTGYSDRDSRVFPQTVAILMIVFSIVSLALSIVRPTAEEGFGVGTWWRRVLLVVAMLVACLLMPYVGFLPAGALAFAASLVAANHGSWDMRTALIYGGSGMLIVTGFYVLFRYVLLVPLP